MFWADITKYVRSVVFKNELERGNFKVKEAQNATKAEKDGDGRIIKETYATNDQIQKNYAYIGVRSEQNNRLLRGTSDVHLDINLMYKPSQCGCYAILWDDVRNGFVDGLPSFKIPGGYAANLDIICDYNNDSFPTVHQTLRLRCHTATVESNLLIFTRCYCDNVWSRWQRLVSAEELQEGRVVVKEATHAEKADTATKATQDGNGNNISSTYATKTALTDGTLKVKESQNAETAEKASKLSIGDDFWHEIGRVDTKGIEYRINEGIYFIIGDVLGTDDNKHIIAVIDIKYGATKKCYSTEVYTTLGTVGCRFEYDTETTILKATNIVAQNVKIAKIA